MREKHNTLPFTYDGWDGCGDEGDIQFYNVEFTEDFGPFKKGRRYNSVARMDSLGILAEYDEEGREGAKCNIRYTVAE
jgi:GTP-dependent phosphoenolpyruvate carboxykinase